eukprot:gene8588-6028_t
MPSPLSPASEDDLNGGSRMPRSVRLLRGPRLPSSSSPPSSRHVFQTSSPNNAPDCAIVFENDSNGGYGMPRRRPRQVIYIYDDDDDGSYNVPEPEEVNNGPTSVVCCCHQEKKAVSPLNPRIGLPGPIALFAFGTTVGLGNIEIAGLCDHNAYLDWLCILFGGLVQFVCGYFELVNKNTVGCIICTGYGAYNMINGFANVVPTSAGPAQKNFMGGFFLMWMFYALTVLIMCLQKPISITVMNTLVVINFFLCSLGNWMESTDVLHAAGFEGIVVGSVAVYNGMAAAIAVAYGRDILPTGIHDNFRNLRW